MMSIEFLTHLISTGVFQFLGFQDTLKNRFVHFLTVQLMPNQRTVLSFPRIKMNRLIYKRFALCHLMTNSHPISIKLIEVTLLLMH